jgi:hypothetical protein
VSHENSHELCDTSVTYTNVNLWITLCTCILFYIILMYVLLNKLTYLLPYSDGLYLLTF